MAVIQKEHYRINLPELQATCERNYVSLMRLLPNMRSTNCSCRIVVETDYKITTELMFNVIENTPYTTYIYLKQSNILDWLVSPQLYIRCYHDVRLAEVTFAQNTRNFKGIYGYPNKAMHQPDEKRQLNRFVEEWLMRCLATGYEVKPIRLG